MRSCAVFLDRDGVLIRDVGPLAREEDIQVLPGVAAALRRLGAGGFQRIVVSNQTAVSRGLISEDAALELQQEVQRRIRLDGGDLDAFYYCPHHPQATDERYRMECACRKPLPGLVLRAARDFELDLDRSYMVGDRISDVQSGAKAGCKTILVETGRHDEAPIIGAWGPTIHKPDARVKDLAEAVGIILRGSS